LQFIEINPPRMPALASYGEEFAEFLDGLHSCRSIPYLGDVARIELARGRAYHAADAEPLPRQAFADLPQDRIGDQRVTLHPSMSIVVSSYPALSIWEVNQSGAEGPVASWGPEATLIARPFLEVETRRLSAGTDTFLLTLHSGATMGEAVLSASAASPAFDASEGLAVLIGANLAVGLSEAKV